MSDIFFYPFFLNNFWIRQSCRLCSFSLGMCSQCVTAQQFTYPAEEYLTDNFSGVSIVLEPRRKKVMFIYVKKLKAL